MAAEDYHADFFDPPEDWADDYDPGGGDPILDEFYRRREFKRRARMHQHDGPISEEAIQKNKFYVGSALVFKNNWGHRTLEKAIAHGEKLLQDENRDGDSVVVVQIIRVIQRQPRPVIVKEVPPRTARKKGRAASRKRRK